MHNYIQCTNIWLIGYADNTVDKRVKSLIGSNTSYSLKWVLVFTANFVTVPYAFLFTDILIRAIFNLQKFA